MPKQDRRRRGNSGPRWRAIMPKLKRKKRKGSSRKSGKKKKGW